MQYVTAKKEKYSKMIVDNEIISLRIPPSVRVWSHHRHVCRLQPWTDLNSASLIASSVACGGGGGGGLVAGALTPSNTKMKRMPQSV